MPNKTNLLFTALGLAALVVVALILWLKPSTSSALSGPHITHPVAPVQITVPQPVTSTASAASNTASSIEALAPSLQGTEIDCALTTDATGKLVLDGNIRPCFEYFLTQIGEKTLPAINQQVRQHLARILPASAAQQASDLWQRYLNYREEEGKLQVNSNTNDAQHLQQVVNALSQLRQRHFNRQEISALFGDEMTYNQYTIDRVNIIEDKTLTESQKAQQLKQRFAQLPPDLQKNMEDINKLQDLRALTRQIKARHGSQAELQQMREQLVGPEAAQRLQQLDQSRASWQNRVQDYLAQRQTILNSQQAAQDKQQAITALRERQFATEAERQRAISYEHFKDQGTDIRQLLQ